MEIPEKRHAKIRNGVPHREGFNEYILLRSIRPQSEHSLVTRAIHERFIAIADQFGPTLKDSLQQVGPMRFRRRNDRPLSEVLCRIVTGQQLSTKAAATIWGRVVDRAGDQPVAEFIATTSLDQLRQCGMSRSKANAMKEIASADAQGLLDVDRLAKLKHAQRSRQLNQIWGVGPWTADIVGLSYFGDKDVWPQSDVTVCNTLQRLIGRRRSIARTASCFAPYRSYLALYMWSIADAKPE